MAIQSFFRPRRPRSFDHKYIYWDARREALERRVERIHNELIDKGEIEGEKTHKFDGYDGSETYDSAKRIRGKFVAGTQHLQKQIDAGIDRHERRLKMIRLMLMLMGFCFLVWYFIFR